MPYNYYGTELSTAYNYHGAELQSVYGYDGTEYPLVTPNPILFSDIPSYFQDDITAALTYVGNLSNDYVNYIVVTDSHYDLSRTRHTAVLMNYLYQEGRFDKLIHLGDIVDGGGFNDTGWQMLVEDDWWHFKGHWLYGQGNHDSAWNTSLATLGSYFESTKNIRYTINAKHNLYYYDNDIYKIRIIGCHHYGYKDDPATMNAYVSAAVNKGYKWMFIGHYRVDDSGDWVKDAVETYGNFICSLSGHRHTDTFRTLSTTTKTLLDINLEADIQGQVAGEGTDSEQCITLVSINPKTENIKLYRIGLTRAYSPTKQWEFTGFGS